jgi:hypothetical protein
MGVWAAFLSVYVRAYVYLQLNYWYTVVYVFLMIS